MLWRVTRAVRGIGTATAWGARLAISVAGAALVLWAATADAHWAERHVLPGYCATSVPEDLALPGLRGAAAALGVVAVLLLAPAVGRRLRGATLRWPFAGFAGVAVAVAASLGTGELIMRRLHERIAVGAQARAEGGAPMTRVDPRLGWAYLPGRTTWAEVGGRRVSYAIDAEGDRAASPDRLPDPDRPTILFAGESIAFGYGLAFEETFPFLVGRDLGVQAVNLAVVGYGSDQAHLRVLDALERVRRPLAVVTLFVPGQIRRNVDVWRPRLALRPDGGIAPVPPSSGPRLARLLEQLPYHGDDALRVTAAILRATAEAARSRGALPLFVVTNYGPACLRERDEEPWIVEELFVRQALPFVRVDLEAGDLLPGLLERHPGPRGSARIAAAVEGALAERLAAARGRR
jgi:hypothetical protein